MNQRNKEKWKSLKKTSIKYYKNMNGGKEELKGRKNKKVDEIMYQTSKERQNGREINTKYRKERKWIKERNVSKERRKEMNEKNEWIPQRERQTKKFYKILKTKKNGQTNILMEDILLRNKTGKIK